MVELDIDAACLKFIENLDAQISIFLNGNKQLFHDNKYNSFNFKSSVLSWESFSGIWISNYSKFIKYYILYF